MRPRGNTTLTTRATQAKRAAILSKLWFMDPILRLSVPIFLGGRNHRGGDAPGIVYTKPQRIQADCKTIRRQWRATDPLVRSAGGRLFLAGMFPGRTWVGVPTLPGGQPTASGAVPGGLPG